MLMGNKVRFNQLLVRISNHFEVPFGDPYWYQDWNSPYYNDSHVKWRDALREFVEKEIMPFCHEWDEKKAVPKGTI